MLEPDARAGDLLGGPDVRFGSKADIGACPRHVRFTPKSGHWLSALGCPLCAKSRHQPPHSITASALASGLPSGASVSTCVRFPTPKSFLSATCRAATATIV